MSGFTWRGASTSTIGELLDAICTVDGADEGAEFMAEYRRHNEHADSNVGYLIGYVEPAERRQQLYGWLGVHHPVFGGTP